MHSTEAVAGNVPRRLGTRTATTLGVAVLLTLAVTGCATAQSGALAPSPSSTPCVVQEQPGQQQPADCLVYDPEDNLAANELYRERIPLSVDAQTAGEAYLEPVNAALTALRSTGASPTEVSVSAALADAGLKEEQQLRERTTAVLFGVAIPDTGGCVFGEISTEAQTVEVGGYIMDGGCLAGVGH